MSFHIAGPPATPTADNYDDRPRPHRQQSQFRPVVAPSPGGYQQGTGYANRAPSSAVGSAGASDGYFPVQGVVSGTQPGMNGTRGTLGMQQQLQYHGYGSPEAQHQQQQQQQQQGMDGLAQQMGQMEVDGSARIPAQTRRKKDRHAYHQMEPVAASAPSSGPAMLQSEGGEAPGAQYWNGQSGQPSPAPAAPWQHHTTQPWQSNQIPTAQVQTPAQPADAPISMGMQPGAGAGVGGAPPQGKVNPDQIPSVPVSRDVPAEYYQTHIYPTMEQHLPPPATTPFVAYDQGNASPKYARLTLNCIPAAHDQLVSTGLPLGLVLQPLAKPTDGEQAIPVLDFGDAGPPRCRRCRAYINPFMQFSNGGSRMTCNLCGYANEVPMEYFAPVDPSGARVDRLQRPELLLGTCEFLVPKEYWSKEPLPMRYLFLLDVSAEACARGFLQGVCDGVLAALYGSDGDEATTEGEEMDGEMGVKPSQVPEGAKVGFLTFSRTIHFYDVSASVSAPQQLVLSDLEDPFAALSPDRLFVDAAQCRKNITTLLRQLPSMFAQQPDPEPALLPSLNVALAALEGSGGKVICSLAALPTHGPGRLHPRDKGQTGPDDGEPSKDLLKTDHALFRKCQADMVKAGVGVDFFLAAPMAGYLDIATIGFVAEKTGGETYYYPNWSYPRDALRLAKELAHTVQRAQGYAALMKVRCSNGLQIAHYSGNFTQHTFGADLELASVTQDSGMSVGFAFDGKVSVRLNPLASVEERRRATRVELDPKLDAHFQAALLYTTTSGQRRVRTLNLVASVTATPLESFRYVDQDAVCTLLAKEAASRLAERPLKAIRQSIQDRTIEILAGYRKLSAGARAHPAGQLVLPENLKELAMLVLGLLKSRALKAGREPSDRRVHEARMIKAMGPAELSLYLYPRIWALHALTPEAGFPDPAGHLVLPRAVRASFACMEAGGAYLVDNGQVLLLWLHAQVSPHLLEDLFGPAFTSLADLDPNLSSLPVLDTHLNAQTRNLLLHLEQQRGSKGLAVQLARQGLDGAEFEFARLLFEDRNAEASAYVDWLVLLHRGVGTEMNGQRAKGATDEGTGSGAVGSALSSLAGAVPYWG